MFIVFLCATILVASKMVVGEMSGTGSKFLLGSLSCFTLFFLADLCSLFWTKDTEDVIRIFLLSAAVFFIIRMAQEFRLYIKKQKRKAEFAKLKAKREREDRYREQYKKLLERSA